MPLDTGNQWVYRGAGSTFTIEVGATQNLGGQDYYAVTGSPADPLLLLRKDKEGRIYAYNVKDKEERLYLDLTQDRAASTVDACSVESAVESRNAKVTTPIGSFDAATLVHYLGYKCADAGISADYFLPSVGLIRRVANTIAGPVTYDLVYAKLGTVTVITQPETSFGMALAPVKDRKVEENLAVRLTLRHTAEKPLTLQFSSGQTYQIVVFNSKGEQIYTWSATRLFPQVMRNEQVSGERNWTELIPVKDWPAGRYVAQAWLTTSDGINFGAMAPFELP